MYLLVFPIKIFEKYDCIHAILRQGRRFFSNQPVDTNRSLLRSRDTHPHQKDDHCAMRPTHSMTTTGIAAAASTETAFAATSATDGASIIPADGVFIYSGQKKNLVQVVAYSRVTPPHLY
jgi:hypothetical protein